MPTEDASQRSVDPLAVLRSMKRATYPEAREDSLHIPGDPPLSLVPVGPWALTDERLIEQMVTWRFNASEMFFAQFPPSVEGMRRYVESHAITAVGNLLFIIESADGAALGHVGVAHVTQESFEVDAVMKASTIEVPRGTMRRALMSMTDWAHEHLGVEFAHLQVVSHNVAAIRLYEDLGFKVATTTPLRRVTFEGFTQHKRVEPSEANVTYCAFDMELRLSAQGG